MDIRHLVPEWIRTLDAVSAREADRGARARARHPRLDQARLEREPARPVAEGAGGRGRGACGRCTCYPDGSAFYLRRRLAERHGVSPDDILVGNGSNEIIELVVRTFLRPRDEAVMADQAFVIYRMVVQAVGGDAARDPAAQLHPRPRGDGRGGHAAHAARVPRQPEQPDRHDLPARSWEAFLRALAAAPADRGRRRRVRRLRRGPGVSRTRSRSRGDGTVPVVTLRTFSKLYGLAGLRIGYAVAPGAGDRGHAAHPPAVQRERARAGRRAGGARRPRARRAHARGEPRGHAHADARPSGVSGCRSCRARRTSSWCGSGSGLAVYDALLRRGVIVRPMDGYGLPEHLRVTIGLPEENAALRRGAGGGPARGR